MVNIAEVTTVMQVDRLLPYHSKTLVWIPTFQYKMKTPNFRNDPKV
jgi:hypothetical protein